MVYRIPAGGQDSRCIPEGCSSTARMYGQDGQPDTGDVRVKPEYGPTDAWRHASDWGRPILRPASRMTQRPVTRLEVEIRDSEAELGGEMRGLAERVGRSVAQGCARPLYTI